MKNIAIYKNKRSGEVKAVILQSPCFRVFTVSRNSHILSTSFLSENDILYFGYIAEDITTDFNSLKNVWESVFNNNPLFEGCTITTTAQLREQLDSIGCGIAQRTSYGESGYGDISAQEILQAQGNIKLIFLQKVVTDKYPKGIPTHQFIVANFTARNIAQMNSALVSPFKRLVNKMTENGKHPFLAYVIYQMLEGSIRYYGSNNQELCTRNLDSRESDNISRESFGSLAYLRLSNFLQYGGRNPLDKGDYLITQRGYQRDTELSSVVIQANEQAGFKRLMMSDSLSIQGDNSFFHQVYSTCRYVNEFIKTLTGEFTQPVLPLTLGEIVYLKDSHFGFNNATTDRRPHRPLSSLSGLVVTRDQVIGFDPTRVESIQLKISGWVMPSAISETPDSNVTNGMFQIYKNSAGDIYIPSCLQYGGSLNFYKITLIKNKLACFQNEVAPERKNEALRQFYCNNSESFRSNQELRALTTVPVEDITW